VARLFDAPVLTIIVFFLIVLSCGSQFVSITLDDFMKTSHMRSFLFNLTMCMFIVGCTSRHGLPDFGVLYNRSAQHHDEKRNPIILIPGILGSKLIDAETGQVVWGAFEGGYANPRTPEGARLIALPMREGARLDHLRDGVVSDGALDRLKVKVASLPIEIGAYVHVMKALGMAG
jgi:hypothetical protein